MSISVRAWANAGVRLERRQPVARGADERGDARDPVVFALTGGDVSRLSGFDLEERSGDGAGALVEGLRGVRGRDRRRFLLPHHIAGRSEQRHEQRLQRESNGATLHERLPRLM